MGVTKIISIILLFKDVIVSPRATLFKMQDCIDANKAVEKNRNFRRTRYLWDRFKRKVHRLNARSTDEWKYMLSGKRLFPTLAIVSFLTFFFIGSGIVMGYIIWGI